MSFGTRASADAERFGSDLNGSTPGWSSTLLVLVIGVRSRPGARECCRETGIDAGKSAGEIIQDKGAHGAAGCRTARTVGRDAARVATSAKGTSVPAARTVGPIPSVRRGRLHSREHS